MKVFNSIGNLVSKGRAMDIPEETQCVPKKVTEAQRSAMSRIHGLFL